MAIADKLVLRKQHHLKWRWLDWLELALMIVCGVLCENLNRIVRSLYLGFSGDFVFFDTQGGNDPQDPIYTGLGSRFVLVYLTPSDLDGLG